MQIKNHRLGHCSFYPSPHADDRPDDSAIDLLVIHGISLPAGEFGGPWITELFLGTLDCQAHPDFDLLQGLRVSAHCLIRRDGQIIQYVPFNKRAWHAGQSSWQGRERCNDFSIGIELEGTDNTPYTEQQYKQLVSLTKTLQSKYPAITDQRIVGHEHIAPGRKTDPGEAFRWDYYRQLLSAENP